MSKKISFPRVLWVAIVSLAIFSVVHFITGLSQITQFFAFAINLLLIYGLLRLVKWACFIAIIASLAGPFVLSLQGTFYYYIILLLNLTVLIPVVLSSKAFFPKITDQTVTT